jgi:hypothetical protein
MIRASPFPRQQEDYRSGHFQSVQYLNLVSIWFLGTLPSGQRCLIAKGQPVVLGIEVTEVKDAEEKQVVEQM